MLTIKKVVALLKRHQPADVYHAVKVDIPLEFLGQGCYRSTLAVKGLPIVIKFPHRAIGTRVRKYNMRHTRLEVAAIRKIGKIRGMRKHVPELFYWSKKTGVVVMRRYDAGTVTYGNHKLSQLIEKLEEICDITEHDFGGYNIGKDKKGNIVFLDLGLVGNK